VTAPAGWFPDPAGRPGTYRWWDGSAWSRVLSDDATAPAPDPGPAGPTADPAPDAVPARPQPSGPGSRHRVYPPGYEPVVRRARPRRSSRIGAVLSIAAVVAIAAVVLTIVINGRTSSAELLTAPPSPTRAPASDPTAQPDDLGFDELSRAVSLTGLKATMPGEPYSVTESTLPAAVLQDGVQGVATVQSDYDDNGSDWVAVVGVGHVPTTLIGKDLPATADAVFDRFVAASFSGKVSVKKVSRKTFTDYPRPVRIINAQVHYKVKGVRSTYDKVSLLVLEADNGRYVSWLSSRPNTAGSEVEKALQASINSIQIVK
jgi:hypothetical protein